MSSSTMFSFINYIVSILNAGSSNASSQLECLWGHYKSTILSLDVGADIDADFDKSMEEAIKLMVLDVAEEIASQ
jgi:hypothetical protein